MFSNTHCYSMDKKGRVSIPSLFREFIKKSEDNEIVLTINQTGGYRYLIAMPLSAWEPTAKTVEGEPFDEEARNYRRYLISRMETCPLDRQGRILIPPRLREYAGLNREVALVGVGDSFEIWDRQAFDKHFDELDAALGKKGPKSQNK